jgi:CelD/BcsL family acetyltransferase involved in cellulose biosynthesis
MVLHGLPADRYFLQAVTRLTEATHRAFMLNPVDRCVASLQDGLDGFLSRRTNKFRVNARRALKRAERAGLQFNYFKSMPQDQIDSFYTSILAVEAASWKSLQGEGADQEPMRSFYREMFRRIIPGGMLRAIIAELGGEDVGYIHGAFLDSRFRGLQLSFDDRCRELSIGNVLQLKMIEWLSREGAQQYDLGMCVAYKRNWAELEQATLTLYLRPRRDAG